MASEADEANLSLLFGFDQRFGRSARPYEEVRIVREAYAVNLPEVDVVGLKPAQALFKHLGGERAIATMGTDFGHEEGLVTPSLETFAEPIFGFAAAILPTTVIEGNAAIQSRMDNLDRGLFILGYTNMMSSGTEGRDPNVGLPKTPEWNVPASFHATLMHICFDPVRVAARKTVLDPCEQV
jgi:hypothetical protein